MSVTKSCRLSLRECQRLLDETNSEPDAPAPALTPAVVAEAIARIAPSVKVGRQWYAVFRVLCDRGYYRNIYDLPAFQSEVKATLGERKVPSIDGMQRVATLSFLKPVAQWDASRAPVLGKRFDEYLAVARLFGTLLEQLAEN